MPERTPRSCNRYRLIVNLGFREYYTDLVSWYTPEEFAEFISDYPSLVNWFKVPRYAYHANDD